MKSIYIGAGQGPHSVNVGETFFAIGVKSNISNLDTFIEKYKDQITVDYRAPEVGNFGYFDSLEAHVLQLGVFTRTK